MRRRPLLSVILTLVVVFGALAATIASGNKPQLGLDLQGGISVVLAPAGTKNVSGDTLDVAVDIIRSRVDALGVAEPEISRQGGLIVIDLPGVKDRDKAAKLVGKTAELRFRKVLGCLPAEGKTTTTTSSTAPASSAPGDTTGATGESTTAPTTTAPATTAPASSTPPDSGATSTTTATGERKTTQVEEEKADQEVIFKGTEPCSGAAPRYDLGPTLLTGKAVKGAKSQYEAADGWGVTVDFSKKGAKDFNAKVAAPNVNQRVGIVLDSVVQSAPVIRQADLGSSVRISGSFKQGEAKDLATVLKFGSLPVALKTETIQNVSPSLGKDQLHAGIAAGVVGLLLVAFYMLLYYRILGAVVIGGLLLSAVAIYSLVAFLGQSIGLTLTLAGVTGLIVSVGVTVDSYVVYFERLKDEVRTGKTLRSSLDRGFTRAFRTIVAADSVSLIGAAVLYWLAIGSVRGFALFLGISTLLDLIVSYVFMHPMVALMARRPSLVRMKRFGMGAGLDERELQA
jgi:preprotein translocase subunit SecD